MPRDKIKKAIYDKAYRKDYYAKKKEICNNASRMYNKLNKEKLSAHYKDWYKDNKQIKKEYQESNKDNILSKRMFRHYGITLSQYNEMLIKQNGVCAICHQPETRMNKDGINRLAIDHDHKTGKIRGLLCSNCNVSIGLLKDSSDRCRQMAEYLDNNA